MENEETNTPATTETPTGGQPTTPVETTTPVEPPAAPASTAEAEADQVRSQLTEAQSQLSTITSERDALRTQIDQTNSRLRSMVIGAVCRDLGIVDAEAAERLADFSAVDATETSAVKPVLEALLAAKPYLKPGVVPPVVPPGGGERSSTVTGFTRSQISDRKFYNANRDAIMVALREGRITD